jgi:hypothetical protein
MTREKYKKNIDDLEKIINKKIYNPYSLEYEKLNPPKEQNQESNQEGQAQPNTEEDSSKDYLEKAGTYIRIRIMLSQPVNPILPDIELPEPIKFIKKEKPPKKSITPEEIENDLIRK